MSQHTPGPLTDSLKADGTFRRVLHGPSGKIVAVVWSEADSRLFAKAPEMVTMLASCLAYFDDMKHATYEPNGPSGGRMTGEVFAPDPEWTAPIRALLREIEGEII